MKKIIYIASFLCAALLAGCDDFLTTESPRLFYRQILER